MVYYLQKVRKDSLDKVKPPVLNGAGTNIDSVPRRPDHQPDLRKEVWLHTVASCCLL